MGIAGNLSVGIGLSVKEALTVSGDSTFFNNITVKSPGTKVKASQFEGQADAANQVQTKKKDSGNNHFITFVDSNNDDFTNEQIFTDAGIQYNPTSNQLELQGDIVAFVSSDERLKDNVTPLDDPLAKVLSLGGYTFDWNQNSNKEGTETGLIAQEIENLGLPGLVTTRDNGYKAVRYEKLVPLLIEAIKELSDKVSSLEDRLNN